MSYDVVIIGAGVSGVPAAAAAARAGARTLLLEKTCRLGGTMADSLGFPVCGLFQNGPPRLLNPGLPAEWLSAVTGRIPDAVFAMGKVTVCRCPLPLFQQIYRGWTQMDNLTVCFGAQNIAPEMNANRIESVSFDCPDGPQRHSVGQAVDCTGCGEIILKSGAQRIVPKKLPLAGFSVRLSGVGPDELLSVKVPYVLCKAADAGALPASAACTVFSMEASGSALCKFSVPSEMSQADAEDAARRGVQHLQQNIPAFESAQVVAVSPAVLQREGPRLKGAAVLTADDVRSGRHVEDAAARGCWPMEYWDPRTGVQYDYVQDAYDIPLRALRSVNIENLWAAGRLVSADSAALASVRVMGTAMATGEAAGRAAAKELT